MDNALHFDGCVVILYYTQGLEEQEEEGRIVALRSAVILERLVVIDVLRLEEPDAGLYQHNTAGRRDCLDYMGLLEIGKKGGIFAGAVFLVGAVR